MEILTGDESFPKGVERPIMDQSRPMTATKRVVLAESYRLIVPAMIKALQAGGCEVSHTATAREIVQVMNEMDAVAALVINLDSDRCGGLDTVRYIRRLESGRTIKVLGITHHCDRASVINAVRAGVNSVLLKDDCTPQLVMERVRQLLSEADGPAEPGDVKRSGQTGGPRSLSAPSPGSAAESNAAAPSAPTNPQPQGTPQPQPAARQEEDFGKWLAPLSREDLEQKLPEMLEGRALRPIVQRVIMMASNPNTDAADLAQLLRNDLDLSAKVISAANSSFYRRNGHPVRNIQDAVNRIGLNSTRNLAATIGIIDHFVGGREGELAIPGLWVHSIATAHISEALARHTSACDADQAFIIGLLHGLGRRVLADFFPKHYARVLRTPETEPATLLELERRLVGIDHLAVGAMVVEKWGLPSFVTKAMRLHRSSTIQSERGEDPLGGLSRNLLAADALAIALGFGTDALEELPMVPRAWLARQAKSGSDFIEKLLDIVHEAQSILMSRAEVPMQMPRAWRATCSQIVMLGMTPHMLEPLQVTVSHGLRCSNVTSPAQADLSCRETLVLGDMRSMSSSAEVMNALAWLKRAKAPTRWPVLVAVRPEVAQDEGLLKLGYPIRVIAPPLRPSLIQRELETLLGDYRAAA
jgi:putative nucleotidyltransferase with HDIG domain